MKFKVFVLTLRAMVMLFFVGFIAINGKNYLANSFGITVNPYIYFAATFICICFTLWLSVRPIPSELRLMAVVEKKEVASNTMLNNSADIGSVYKYPRRIGYLFLTLTILGCFLPFIYPNTRGSIFLTSLTVLVFLLVGITTAIYFFRYKIYIFIDKMVVSSFVWRENLLSDIADVSVVRGRDGLWALVLMKNGKIVRLRGSLNNFDGLVSILKSHASV